MCNAFVYVCMYLYTHRVQDYGYKILPIKNLTLEEFVVVDSGCLWYW